MIDTTYYPIERDESYNRDYITMPGGWEIQTKGNGSSFRIADRGEQRLNIPDEPYLHETLTTMAREVHAAWEATCAERDALRNELESLRERVDVEVCCAQAVEFAQYVVEHAKGKMVEAAQRFLSLPYSQELVARLKNAEYERVRKMLNTYGVSDERMRGSIATGLDVLVTRTDKQVAALTAQCEGLRKDAERWQYTQQPGYFSCGPWNQDGEFMGHSVGVQKNKNDGLNHCIRGTGKTLREAIDAAIAAGNGEGAT